MVGEADDGYRDITADDSGVWMTSWPKKTAVKVEEYRWAIMLNKECLPLRSRKGVQCLDPKLISNAKDLLLAVQHLTLENSIIRAPTSTLPI